MVDVDEDQIMATARIELERAVNSGRISASQARRQLANVQAALAARGNFAFGVGFGGFPAHLNPQYWTTNGPNSPYYIRPGTKDGILAALRDIFARRQVEDGKQIAAVGCSRVCQFIFLYGQMLYNGRYNPPGNQTINNIIGNNPPADAFPEDAVDGHPYSYGPFQQWSEDCEDGFPIGSLLPGDRIWIINPYNDDDPHPGEEGSNTIYLGDGLFLNLYGGEDDDIAVDHDELIERIVDEFETVDEDSDTDLLVIYNVARPRVSQEDPGTREQGQQR